MPLLEVQQISKSFGETQVLHRISFSVENREIVCLLGPSGCGKTTLLRIIAGLETPDAGRVLYAGQDLREIPVHQRNFGLMFQDFALFPHKDVFGNVAFGLRMKNMSTEEVQTRVREVLELVGLAGFEERDVNELSGGEQQRVALARSLAPRPRLLMLDEPLGSLDRALRERLMDELRDILKGVGVTSIYVTHDQEEAFAIADRVVIMREGRKVQEGRPEEVYRCPATPFVAHFLGLTNLLPAALISSAPIPTVQTPIGPLSLSQSPTAHRQSAIGNRQFTILIRPEAAILLNEVSSPDLPNVIEGTLVERSFRGGYYRLVVRHDAGLELSFQTDATARLPGLGERVRLALRPEAITVCGEREANAREGQAG